MQESTAPLINTRYAFYMTLAYKAI